VADARVAVKVVTQFQLQLCNTQNEEDKANTRHRNSLQQMERGWNDASGNRGVAQRRRIYTVVKWHAWDLEELNDDHRCGVAIRRGLTREDGRDV